jgi:hypothetical protein
VTAGPYAALTVVRDGAGYVLGRRGGTDFVAVPEIGGQVIHWLQDGASVGECERRAADLAGEPVDVSGFLDGLARAGLLPAAGPHSRGLRRRRLRSQGPGRLPRKSRPRSPRGRPRQAG